MHRAERPAIKDLQLQLTCKLCKGFYIDATTIIECLHTFCRSCIVQYLAKSKYCPVCDVQVHKTRPLLNIRPDKIVQDLVYKLVPRLYQNELQRRKEFYALHPETSASSAEMYVEGWHSYLLTPDETVNLKFAYFGVKTKPRYLQCPAAVSIAHLKKLIQAKYDLNDNHRVEVLYNQDCLNSSLTLMDIAYIYNWKKNTLLELSYKIYENTKTKAKLENDDDRGANANANNNNWKEVQLRISENGEMSITGIQDSQLLDIVNNSDKYKGDLDPVVDAPKPTKPANKKELPALKAIVTPKNNPACTKQLLLNSVKLNSAVATATTTKTTTSAAIFSTVAPTTSTTSAPVFSSVDIVTTTLHSIVPTNSVVPLFANVATTKTVYSTIDKTKCSTKTDDQKISNNCGDKGIKRKIAAESGPNAKQPKQTILNQSVSLLNVSNNYSLKRHTIKQNKNGEQVKSPPEVVVFSKPGITITTTTTTRPGTPKPSVSQPCYMPKTTYNPVINVPKPTTSASSFKSPAPSPSAPTTTSPKLLNNSTPTTMYNKFNIKSKASTPIGYKTLRDPPKSWNSQISKANLNNKSAQSPEEKSSRPAKFFKMRNNMPRYLGNPASGVKPMYQVSVSPEKNQEIKKHSIVKIDPKTLKPISEKAPETTSLSNQSDLKINTSSVSIFNPLKLQSSPKSDRKSPQSPKLKSNNHSPTSKREKINLNFTPPNPFIPNLASPTLSPNQFLYSSSPSAFPAYDPRMAMAAYQQLWYNHRLHGFPPPMAGLNLDLNQRVSSGFEISLPQVAPPPTSPKLVQATTSVAVAAKSGGKSQGKGTKKERGGSEKSLENAVEKLTQSRAKEINEKAVVSSNNVVETAKDESKERKDDVTVEEVKPDCNVSSNNNNSTNSADLEISIISDSKTNDEIISESNSSCNKNADSEVVEVSEEKKEEDGEEENKSAGKNAAENIDNNNSSSNGDKVAEVAGEKTNEK